MAYLEHIGTGRLFTPSVRAAVGRSPTAALVLADPKVSGEHASLFWSSEGWVIRDLASRNGTWVGERRLQAGEQVSLRAGDLVAFGGRAQIWRLVDDAPPGAMAVGPDGRVRHSRGGLLSLPADADAEVFLMETTGGWRVEYDGDAHPAKDGEVIDIAGARWTLRLPQGAGLDPTIEATVAGPSVADLALRIGVSADEEYVEVEVLLPDGIHKLPPRAYHDLFLVLARERLADHERGIVSSAEEGWVYFDDLCRDLGRDRRRVNVEVFRARQQLAELGVEGAADVFERRAPTRQIRLGVAGLSVDNL